jgi:hypothetical protein
MQVDVDDARLMTSQMSVLTPQQMSSLEKPLNKIIILQVRLSKVSSINDWLG